MILVTARCQVKPDNWEDFSKQVERIIPLVQAEPGCLSYELHSDVYTPGLFIFHEEWESQSHLDTHIKTPHMQEHFTLTTDWMEEPVQLTLYEISNIKKDSL